MKEEKVDLSVIDAMIEKLRKLEESVNNSSQNNIPEFYMITLKGENCSKVRHSSYSVALKEATRLAKKHNHTAHIMGVVAVVEPVEVQKPIIEYQVKKR